MKSKCKIGIALFLLVAASHLFALEVNEKELQSTGTADTIVFINYTGPHSKIDSLESIKKIGSDIGDVIATSRDKETRAGSSKYAVIHAVDPTEKGKLDADILFIGGDATVDHITNLRHIIASYLVAAYGYSESDAETIAVFVTVYNAVYRGKLDQFQSKYKAVVTKNLTEASVGLSVNYKEWPGKSQIIIPLYDINGGLSTIDTTVISDTEVVKHMQQDDDKKIDDRKKMVDIKERESEDSSKKAQESQKKATEEKKKLAEEQKKTQETKKEAETAKKKSEENPGNKELKQEAEKKQTQYEEQKKTEEEQQKKVEEAETKATQEQQRSDRKNEEAQSERKTISKDQQEVIEKEIENSRAPSAYAIKLTDEGSLLSGLVKVNTESGEVIQSSPVTYIRNRTMFEAAGNFIAIAGENSGNGAVKLVLLSPDTMEITAESNEIVAEESVLIQDGGDFYCIIQSEDKWVVGKYDNQLNLKLKGNTRLNPATPMTITSEYVIVSGENGRVIILKKADLKQIEGIRDEK